MKFKLTLYQEIYTDYTVEADSEEAARELIISGNASDLDIDEVTVKDSDIVKLECISDEDEDEEEQTRRDEKNGLYPDKIDIAN
jgi:hypothetical protein